MRGKTTRGRRIQMLHIRQIMVAMLHSNGQLRIDNGEHREKMKKHLQQTGQNTDDASADVCKEGWLWITTNADKRQHWERKNFGQSYSFPSINASVSGTYRYIIRTAICRWRFGVVVKTRRSPSKKFSRSVRFSETGDTLRAENSSGYVTRHPYHACTWSSTQKRPNSIFICGTVSCFKSSYNIFHHNLKNTNNI